MTDSKAQPSTPAEKMREACAKLLENKAYALAEEHGVQCPETGALEFGNTATEDAYNGWLEDAEEIRAIPLPLPTILTDLTKAAVSDLEAELNAMCIAQRDKIAALEATLAQWKPVIGEVFVDPPVPGCPAHLERWVVRLKTPECNMCVMSFFTKTEAEQYLASFSKADHSSGPPWELFIESDVAEGFYVRIRVPGDPIPPSIEWFETRKECQDWIDQFPRAGVAEWQPIETAPKDRNILLWGDYWSDSQGKMPEPLVGNWSSRLGRWECAWVGRFGVRPSHWMPLPAAPKLGDARS